ncbi:MAG: hypothetical protein IPO68_13490 [Chitinophagaceae bacterium]|nr:hypothetical protein [Chitinophagaceae bacterium]
MNDNNKELNMYYNYTNYQFQLKDGFLTITCDVLFYMKNPSFERFGEIKSKEKKVLDIGEIKEVRCEANLVIVNNDGTRANIGFDCYTEENLEARLKKAFNHLKVFYPRKKKKEAF